MTYGKLELTKCQTAVRAAPLPGRRKPTSDSSFRANEPEGSAGDLRAVELVEDLFDLDPEARRDILARERVGDVGGEEADFRAAIEAPAFELQAVEALRAGERDHGVG